MKLSGFAGIVESAMTDKMTISRYEQAEEDDNGVTQTSLEPTPRYTDVPCKVSFPFLESPKDSQVDDNPVKMITKIFCARSVDIIAGDLVVVTRLSDEGEVVATYSGTAGLPAVYATHKEAYFQILESA